MRQVEGLRCWLLAGALLGCSGGAGGDADGAVGADGGGDAIATPPAIPWLEANGPTVEAPQMLPCPAGWREVDYDGLATVCDPFPEGGAASCASDEAHFPGEPGCTRVGSACPVDGLPADLPADRPVIYVLEGAPAGGDGSRGSPYASPTAFSLGGRASGTIIALGRGTYDAILRIPRGLSIRGACVAETVIGSTTASDSEGVLNARGADVEIHNLRIADSARPGTWVGSTGQSMHAEDVVVERASVVGMVSTNGGSLTAQSIVIRSTRPRADGALGRGLSVELSATADVTRAVVEDNRGAGLLCGAPGARGRFEQVVVRDTDSRLVDLSGGQALSVLEGASAEVHDALFERSHDFGVYVDANGASAQLDHLVVRDTMGRLADGTRGRGVVAQRSATGRVTRSWIDGSGEAGIYAAVTDTTLELEDVLVSRTRPRPTDGIGGRGLNVELGATLSVRRGLVHDNAAGAFAHDPDTVLQLEDVTVADADLGRGVTVQLGATARVARLILERTTEVGLYLGGEGATLHAEDLAIRETRLDPDEPTDARAINVELGTVGDVSRALILHNPGSSVFVDGSELVLRDVVVRDAETDMTPGGTATLHAQSGSIVQAERLSLERNYEVGVLGLSPSTRMTLEDVRIEDTRPRDCGAEACSGPEYGFGLGAYGTAQVSAHRFVVARSAVCGVHVANAGRLVLTEGEVSENVIGACVQVDGYDIDTLTEGVVYRDNESNLQTTELPVPEPAATGGLAL